MRHRGRTVLVATVTVLTLVLTAFPAWAQDAEPQAGATISSLTDHVRATIVVAPADDPISRSTSDIAVAPNAVWVVGHRSGIVSRVDPATNQVVAEIAVPVPGCTPEGCSGLTTIAANRRSVWLANLEQQQWVHIDPTTNKVVGTIPAPALINTITPPLLDGKDAWIVLDRTTGTVARVSGETHKVTKTIAVPEAEEYALLGRDGHDLWVAVRDAGSGEHRLRRYDARDGSVVLDVPDPVGAWPADYNARVAGGDLWLAPNPSTRLVRIDGTTGEPVSEHDFGRGLILTLATGGGAVWARRTAPPDGVFERAPWVPQQLERIDVKTDRQSTITLPAAENPSGVAYGGDSLWVGDWTAGAVYRADV